MSLTCTRAPRRLHTQRGLYRVVQLSLLGAPFLTVRPARDRYVSSSSRCSARMPFFNARQRDRDIAPRGQPVKKCAWSHPPRLYPLQPPPRPRQRVSHRRPSPKGAEVREKRGEGRRACARGRVASSSPSSHVAAVVVACFVRRRRRRRDDTGRSARMRGPRSRAAIVVARLARRLTMTTTGGGARAPTSLARSLTQV